MKRKDIIFETLKRQCELAKLEKREIQIESSDIACLLYTSGKGGEKQEEAAELKKLEELEKREGKSKLNDK